MAKTSFADGVGYFLEGAKFITQPGLRRYVAIPILINTIMFTLLLWTGIHYFGEFTTWIDTKIPHWLQWLNVILWLLFSASFLLVLVYAFTMIANLLGAPFNSLLSEKVEIFLGGYPPSADVTLTGLVKDVPRSIGRQVLVIFYYLPRALIFLVLFIIPVANVVAGILWFFFNALMMSIQYTDYPADNHRLPFKEMKDMLAEKRMLSLGFGTAVMFCSMIPVVNLFVMPAAVAGATIMWKKCFKRFHHS